MSLISPRVPYVEIRDALVTLMRTNVASLNTSLTNTITSTTGQIIKGNPLNIPYSMTNYPMVTVDLVSKDEDFKNLGAAGRKYPDVTFTIYGICRRCDDAMTSVDEVINLASNIEGILRDNISFHSSVIKSNPSSTIFNDGVFGEDQVYVHAVAITLVCSIQVA